VGIRHLVVVVPGFGGSVLESLSGELLWGRRRRDLVRAPFWPDRLAAGEPVVPVDLLPTISVLPWMKVAGYDRLVTALKQSLRLTDAEVEVARPGAVPRSDSSLLLFPYDFRESVARSAQRLRDEISARVSGGRRVVVVGHSMGGLVARWWWSVLGGHEVCAGLVTVGTPHRGAPKALDWLLNGVRLGPGRVADVSSELLRDAADVLGGWDSVYELLPRYPAVWQGGAAVYPAQVSVAAPSFQSKAYAAYRLHRELEDACTALTGPGEPARSQVMAFYATGHATAARAQVVDGRVQVTRADAEWLPRQGWDGGDGTVPAFSAIPIEFSGSDPDEADPDGAGAAGDSAEGGDAKLYRRWTSQPHLPIASAPALVKYLADFGSASLAMVRDGQQVREPWLAFDVADVVAAGHPWEFTVGLREADPAAATATVSLLPVDPPAGGSGEGTPVGTGGAAVAATAQRDGEVWRVQVPGLAPGAYRVRVGLDHVPEVDRVTGEDAIGVIEP
jgi:hypothetical protein